MILRILAKTSKPLNEELIYLGNLLKYYLLYKEKILAFRETLAYKNHKCQTVEYLSTYLWAWSFPLIIDA